MNAEYHAAVKDLQAFVNVARREKARHGEHSREYHRARVALDRARERFEDIVSPRERIPVQRGRRSVISRIYGVAA